MARLPALQSHSADPIFKAVAPGVAKMSTWNRLGWEAKVAWNRNRWREPRPWRSGARSSWSTFEIAALVVLFLSRWELGVAFLALKFWQQSSGHGGSVFGFAKLKWDTLVDAAGRLAGGVSVIRADPSPRDMRSFDDWKRAEFERLEGESRRLREAQSEVASLKDDLARATTYSDLETMRRARRS